MKKFAPIAAAFLFAVSAQAQIVSSRTVNVKQEKVPSDTRWIVRTGMNIMNFTGDGIVDTKSTIGYNLSCEFQKPIATKGAYWGMSFGIGSRGCKVEDEYDNEKFIGHNVQWNPFNFGWRINLVDNLALDPHIGVFASYDYVKNSNLDDTETDNDWDIGMNLGVGLWYKKFNFDIAYQRGFKSLYDDFEDIDMSCRSSVVMLRLGYEF